MPEEGEYLELIVTNKETKEDTVIAVTNIPSDVPMLLEHYDQVQCNGQTYP